LTVKEQAISIDQVQQTLRQHLYIADRPLATSIFLALKLARPLFVEGEAGVGKTEVAKVLASMLQRPLIRLQCYEGLDINTAVYEWNYIRQMFEIRLLEASGQVKEETALKKIFSPEFMLKRPLLQAIDQPDGVEPVLLIDELDRADEEFEAFLLEILSDFQVTIPELGTFRATHPPVVIITSNRTREIHDALKRRCLYHWISYPDFEKEYEILIAKVPEAPDRLARQVVAFVQALREEELYKLPGVSETLDWMATLIALDQHDLDEETANNTLGVLLKYHDDIQQVQGPTVNRLFTKVKNAFIG
jgi:MoxR-like ATPase